MNNSQVCPDTLAPRPQARRGGIALINTYNFFSMTIMLETLYSMVI